MYPDILLERGGRSVILDTKWKRLVPLGQQANRKVAQSDVYQLLAYRQAWNAELMALVYPGETEACHVDRLHIPGVDVPFLLIEVPVTEPRRNLQVIQRQIIAELDGLFAQVPGNDAPPVDFDTDSARA